MSNMIERDIDFLYYDPELPQRVLTPEEKALIDNQGNVHKRKFVKDDIKKELEEAINNDNVTVDIFKMCMKGGK